MGVTTEPHENLDTLDLINSSSLNFDGGSKSMWGFL
jgi:hypothetical protein